MPAWGHASGNGCAAAAVNRNTGGCNNRFAADGSSWRVHLIRRVGWVMVATDPERTSKGAKSYQSSGTQTEEG